MYKLGRTVYFDAAHRLSFHEGKCKNLHGHTWKTVIEIFVEPEKDEFQNIIIDFGVIKQIILDNFDHKVLVYKNDTLLVNFLSGTEEIRGTLLECEPTAENLAKEINNLISKELLDKYKNSGHHFALTIRLFETKDSFAEYYKEF